MSLLRSQRNQLFQLLQDHQFSPLEFEWVEIASKGQRFGEAPALRHIPTGFIFIVDRAEYDHGELGFLVRHSPGQEMEEEVRDVGSWGGVPPRFRTWLSYVKRETELPDLWEALTKDTQLIQDADQQPSDNLPFTEAELARVQKALEEIKAYVHKTHELTEAQKKIIDARFDYLEDTAEKLGRKDWMHIVISILLGIGVDQLRRGDSTKDLFLFAREVFKHALGTVLYLVSPH